MNVEDVNMGDDSERAESSDVRTRLVKINREKDAWAASEFVNHWIVGEYKMYKSFQSCNWAGWWVGHIKDVGVGNEVNMKIESCNLESSLGQWRQIHVLWPSDGASIDFLARLLETDQIKNEQDGREVLERIMAGERPELTGTACPFDDSDEEGCDLADNISCLRNNEIVQFRIGDSKVFETAHIISESPRVISFFTLRSRNEVASLFHGSEKLAQQLHPDEYIYTSVLGAAYKKRLRDVRPCPICIGKQVSGGPKAFVQEVYKVETNMTLKPLGSIEECAKDMGRIKKRLRVALSQLLDSSCMSLRAASAPSFADRFALLRHDNAERVVFVHEIGLEHVTFTWFMRMDDPAIQEQICECEDAERRKSIQDNLRRVVDAEQEFLVWPVHCELEQTVFVDSLICQDVDVRFSPHGKPACVEPGSFLCRFSFGKEVQRQGWDDSWHLNARDYSKAVRAELRFYLKHFPADGTHSVRNTPALIPPSPTPSVPSVVQSQRDVGSQPAPAAPREPTTPSRRHCRACGQPGHNTRTCTGFSAGATEDKETRLSRAAQCSATDRGECSEGGEEAARREGDGAGVALHGLKLQEVATQLCLLGASKRPASPVAESAQDPTLWWKRMRVDTLPEGQAGRAAADCRDENQHRAEGCWSPGPDGGEGGQQRGSGVCSRCSGDLHGAPALPLRPAAPCSPAAGVQPSAAESGGVGGWEEGSYHLRGLLKEWRKAVKGCGAEREGQVEAAAGKLWEAYKRAPRDRGLIDGWVKLSCPNVYGTPGGENRPVLDDFLQEWRDDGAELTEHVILTTDLCPRSFGS